MLVPVIYTNIETGRVVYGVLDEDRGQYMSGSVAECERALRASAGYPSLSKIVAQAITNATAG